MLSGINAVIALNNADTLSTCHEMLLGSIQALQNQAGSCGNALANRLVSAISKLCYSS